MTEKQKTELRETAEYEGLDPEFTEKFTRVNEKDAFDETAFLWLIDSLFVEHGWKEMEDRAVEAFFENCDNYARLSDNLEEDYSHEKIYDRYASNQIEYSLKKPEDYENHTHFEIPMIDENNYIVDTVYITVK